MRTTYRTTSVAALLAGLSFVVTARAASPQAFELAPQQRLSFGGTVTEKDKATDAGVDFGVIPTSPIRLKPYYNVFTGMTENRPVPGNPHPLAVLRATKVRAYADKPDLSKLALDQVEQFENEAQLDGTQKFAVVSDGRDTVRLISFSTITLPQDKTADWKLAGTIEPIQLVAHVDDPVADRGRAVLSTEPLPIKGTLIVATRKQNWGPAELYKIVLPDGRMTKFADATEPRVAFNGGWVDRDASLRELRVYDKSGQLTGKISTEPNEANAVAISPDGRKVAVSIERFVEVPNDVARRETVTVVYSFKGKKMGEIIGYDEGVFMPDGRLLLTPRAAGDGLFIGDYTTGKVTPLDVKDSPDGKQPEWPRWPAVSPDGKWVAYVSGRGVFVVGTDGRGWTPVYTPTGEQEPQTVPVFSPDSSLIAVNIIPLNVMTGPGKISVFDLKKKVRQELANTQGADSDVPIVWQP